MEEKCGRCTTLRGMDVRDIHGHHARRTHWRHARRMAGADNAGPNRSGDYLSLSFIARAVSQHYLTIVAADERSL